MSIVKNVANWIIVLILSYFLAIYFGNFYVHFFPQPIGHGSLLNFPAPKDTESILIGLPLAYTLLLLLFFYRLRRGEEILVDRDFADSRGRI